MSNASSSLKKSAVARYLQLASLFRRRIETGEWAAGERIPTVEELSKTFGVATMTIRQSFNILEEEGLIERFRAKGTFVKERPPQDLWCQVQTDFSGMLIGRDGAKIELLSVEEGASLPVRNNSIGRPAERYRHLQRRHLRGGEAFLLADVYISERIVPLIAEADYTSKTALRLVSDIVGLTIEQAHQTLTIGMADTVVADLLNLSLTDPVARVERSAVDQTGELVLFADGVYRGDQVRIDFKLK